jgi:hypothetical protein
MSYEKNHPQMSQNSEIYWTPHLLVPIHQNELT